MFIVHNAALPVQTAVESLRPHRFRTQMKRPWISRLHRPPAPCSPIRSELKNGSKEGAGFKTDVLRRLQIIEDALGLSGASIKRRESVDGGDNEGFDDEEDISDEFNNLGALWDAAVTLQSAPCSVPRIIWRKRTVRDLWLS